MVFENSVPKANFGQNIRRDSPNGSLTADSRSLQTATLKHSNLARLKPYFVGQVSLHVTHCRCSKLLIQLWILSISFWTHCCWCKGCSVVRHAFKRYSFCESCRSCSSWRLALRRTASFCLKTRSRCSLSSLLSFWIRTALFCRYLCSWCCLRSSIPLWNLVAEFSQSLCKRCSRCWGVSCLNGPSLLKVMLLT